ncbi:MAG: hypothetical protein ACE5G9_11140 [Nitrospinales bacterium]
MEISSAQISRIFNSYLNQARIAELNKKANIKSVQGQVDRVDISTAAKQQLALRALSKALAPAEAIDSGEPTDREEKTADFKATS